LVGLPPGRRGLGPPGAPALLRAAGARVRGRMRAASPSLGRPRAALLRVGRAARAHVRGPPIGAAPHRGARRRASRAGGRLLTVVGSKDVGIARPATMDEQPEARKRASHEPSERNAQLAFYTRLSCSPHEFET